MVTLGIMVLNLQTYIMKSNSFLFKKRQHILNYGILQMMIEIFEI